MCNLKTLMRQRAIFGVVISRIQQDWISFYMPRTISCSRGIILRFGFVSHVEDLELPCNICIDESVSWKSTRGKCSFRCRRSLFMTTLKSEYRSCKMFRAVRPTIWPLLSDFANPSLLIAVNYLFGKDNLVFNSIFVLHTSRSSDSKHTQHARLSQMGISQ